MGNPWDSFKKSVKKATKDATKTVKKAAGDVAAIGSASATGGAWSTDGKSGYMQDGTAISGAAKGSGIIDGVKMGASASSNLFKQKDPGSPKMDLDGTAATEKDPYLEEELANARKRSRASTMFAGLSDSIGTQSAKRTLMGA